MFSPAKGATQGPGDVQTEGLYQHEDLSHCGRFVGDFSGRAVCDYGLNA